MDAQDVLSKISNEISSWGSECADADETIERITHLLATYYEDYYEEEGKKSKKEYLDEMTTTLLKNFQEKEITACEELIRKEIDDNDGYIDALDISTKYELPIMLVEGSMAKMEKEGKIGKIEE